MELSRKQKAMLHIVPSALGIDEAQRVIIQANVGGFTSAADPLASREGFVAVMAFYEDRAGGRLDGYSPGYWKQADRDATPADRLRWRVRRDAEALGLPAAQLDAFIAGPHMSNGGCTGVGDASAYWLGRTLEAIKAIDRRARAGELSGETA